MPISNYVNPAILGAQERAARQDQEDLIRLQQEFSARQAELARQHEMEKSRIWEAITRDQMAAQERTAERLTGLQQLELLSKGVEMVDPDTPGAVKVGNMYFLPLTPKQQAARALEIKNQIEEEERKGRAILADLYLKDEDPKLKGLFIYGGWGPYMEGKRFRSEEASRFMADIYEKAFSDPNLVTSPGFKNVLSALSAIQKASQDPLQQILTRYNIEVAKQRLEASDPSVYSYLPSIVTKIPSDAFGRPDIAKYVFSTLDSMVKSGEIPREKVGSVASALFGVMGRSPIPTYVPDTSGGLQALILGAMLSNQPVPSIQAPTTNRPAPRSQPSPSPQPSSEPPSPGPQSMMRGFDDPWTNFGKPRSVSGNVSLLSPQVSEVKQPPVPQEEKETPYSSVKKWIQRWLSPAESTVAMR